MRATLLVSSLVLCSLTAFGEDEQPAGLTHTVYVGPTELAGGVVRGAYELGIDPTQSLTLDVAKSAFDLTSTTKSNQTNVTMQYTNYIGEHFDAYFWGFGLGYRALKMDQEMKTKEDNGVETTYWRHQDQKGSHLAVFGGHRWMFSNFVVRISAGAGYWNAEGKVETSPGMPNYLKNVYKVTDVLLKYNFTSQIFAGYQF